VRRRTRFDAAVAGIVPTGPSFSWGKNGDIAYSIFHNGGWSLFRTHGFPLDEPGEPDLERMALTRSVPEPIQEPAVADAIERDRDYRTRLRPESAVIGALYVGNTGAAGSGQLLLGDMLGNHYLLLGGYLRSEVDESEFLIQYANLGHRWQWGVAGYQYRDDLGLFTAPSDSIQFRSLIRLGAGAQLAYPFNRFRRVEFGLDLQTVTDRVANVLYQLDAYYETDVSRSRYYYVIPSAAFVHDNASFAGFTPVAGARWRVGVEQAVGDIDYTFGVGDYRHYFNIKTRGAIAVRGLLAASTGPETQRLRIGGPDTFRGADFGDISGSKVAFTNTELRFPIFTELLRGVLFVDLAAGWRDHKAVQLGNNDGKHFRLEDLKMAYGFGVRGFVGLPLRIDVGWPTNLVRTDAAFTTFSIGFDY
jgi:outer membrane protein assembly factor BamA